MTIRSVPLIAVAGTFFLAGSTQAQGTKRDLGAHVHGAGKLNLAIEGQTVTMELSAPAHDIVGFEFQPRTDKQKAAVEQATAMLRDASKIFTLSPAAGCTVASASAELVFEARAGPAPAAEGPFAKDHASANSAEAGHSEFEGRYSFACKNTAALSEIGFPYFKLFPKADEIEAQVIAPKGQRSFEIKRGQPRLSLRNLTS